jgi:hypothetical protein
LSYAVLPFASQAVEITVKEMGIGRQDLKAPEWDILTIQVGRVGRDTDGGIRGIAVAPIVALAGREFIRIWLGNWPPNPDTRLPGRSSSFQEYARTGYIGRVGNRIRQASS